MATKNSRKRNNFTNAFLTIKDHGIKLTSLERKTLRKLTFFSY